MSWNPLRKLGSFRSTEKYQDQGTNDPGGGGTDGLNQLTSPNDSSGSGGPGSINDPLEEQTLILSSVENSSKKMLKSARKMTDAMQSLSRMEVKLTTDLSNSSLCQEDSELRNLTEEWHSFNCRLTDGAADYSDTVGKTVVEPTKRIYKMMEEFRMAIKKREELQHKILKMKERVNKLKDKEKTGSNLVKLQQHRIQLEALEEEFRQHNDLLLRELPKFLSTRIDLIQPSIEGYTKAKVLFWGDTLSALTSFPFLSSIESSRVPSWPEYQSKQRNLMKELSELSIVEGNS